MSQARPEAPARSRTSPSRPTRFQVREPSWVAHSPVPNVHPLAVSAKRTSLTVPWLASLTARAALGAGSPMKLRPPSVVRTSDVHGCCVQGASPSNQNVVSLMALNDRREKPAGTGPPEGVEDVGGGGATGVDGAVAPDDTVELVAPASGDPAV